MLKTIHLLLIKKFVSKWLVLAIDLTLVFLSFLFSKLIHNDLSFDFDRYQFFTQAPILISLALISFLIVGSYKGVVRHTGNKDLFNLLFAGYLQIFFFSFLLFINWVLNLFPDFTFSGSLIIIYFLMSIFLMSSSRFAIKRFYELLNERLRLVTRVMIYGAGNSGMITYAALSREKKNKFDVVGFIDDNPNKINKKINRTKIFNSADINAKFIEENKIQEIIFSMPKLSSSRFLEITNLFLELKVKVKTVPSIVNWIKGDLQADQIKKINIDDLLERDKIDIYNPLIMSDIIDKVVLVTGAAGSIGSEISRQLSLYSPKKLILIDQSESALFDLQQEFIQKGTTSFVTIVSDIRDKYMMEHIFKKYLPTKVYHAAAYKHVPLMEETPYEAIKVNVLGTKILADLSVQSGVEHFIMISTDKAVNPSNVMGATKRLAELYISYFCNTTIRTKFTITRFGNVLGSNGSVIPLFKKQIQKGGPLTVTHNEITRYFMTIPEACSLVLEAATMGKGGEIYVFDMGKSLKIFDVAKRIINLAGFNYPEDIDIKITGLRPGEKLYEELIMDYENSIKTHNEKILILKTNQIVFVQTKEKIENIIDNLYIFNNKKLVSLMKEIIPEFISKNSEFEELDKNEAIKKIY